MRLNHALPLLALFAFLLPKAAEAVLPLPLAEATCGESDATGCPQDMQSNGDWHLFSFIPDSSIATIRPEELLIGSGNHVDRAFQLSTGRYDVLVSVLDSGFRWRDEDVLRKYKLNTAELPHPICSDGQPSASWDCNGDGIENIDDWVDDPRVAADTGHPQNDATLDPQDLIWAFSDSVDDDGNGYIDDICGWDFYHDDNDPMNDNDVQYGDHGPGVAQEVAAEGGDGGDIGGCPNCALLPLRTGDSFIAMGQKIAQAMRYAADMGAVTGTLAMGGMTYNPMVRDAIAYAWDKGTVFAAAAGDEASYHHNYPALDRHNLYVHSVAGDTNSPDGNWTFNAYVNCNNFGARLDLVAATHACATGAVGQTSGAIGLMHSYAKDLGITLTAPEVRQILLETSSEVEHWDLGDPEPPIDIFPAREGWDRYYGRGRLSVRSALDRITADRSLMPPPIEITSPLWFETYDSSVESSISLEGSITSPAGADLTWTARWGIGEDPRSWHDLAGGTGSGSFAGTLTSVTVADLEAGGFDTEYSSGTFPPDTSMFERHASIDGYVVTFLIDVEDSLGNTSTAHRAVFVHHDPAELEGFPKNMGESLEASPTLADLDDDTIFEIVLAGSGGTVHVLKGDGSELNGWPQKVGRPPSLEDGAPGSHVGSPGWQDEGALDEARQHIIASPAVGDLDGDGSPEVVVSTLSGQVWAWHADGSLVSGFPTSMDRANCYDVDLSDEVIAECGFFASPVLYDWDGDGKLEIIAAGMDQYIYIWRFDGSPQAGFPLWLNSGSDDINRIISTPAVGDVDGDGKPEIITGSGSTIGGDVAGFGLAWRIEDDGSIAPDWPVAVQGLINGMLPLLGIGVAVSPAIATWDDQTRISMNATGNTGDIYGADGTILADLPNTSGDFGARSNTTEGSILFLLASPAFGDMTGDGIPELVNGGSGVNYLTHLAVWSRRIDHAHLLGAWDGASNKMLSGFPQVMEDLQFFTSPVIADVDGDELAEAIMVSGGYMLHAFAAGGGEPEGWPHLVGGWALGSPAVGDVNGDGFLDVVAVVREGYVHAFSTEGPANGTVEWASFHHDAQNTGNYNHPLPEQKGPGCNCKNSQANTEASWAGLLLLPLGLLLRRRRRV